MNIVVFEVVSQVAFIGLLFMLCGAVVMGLSILFGMITTHARGLYGMILGMILLGLGILAVVVEMVVDSVMQ